MLALLTLCVLVSLCPLRLPAAGESLFDQAKAALASLEYSSAQRLFAEVLRLEPTNVEALVGRGDALAHEKRYEEAIECFTEALRLQPGDAWVLFLRHEAYLGSNRLDRAMVDIDSALAVRPESAFFLEARAKLWRLKKNYVRALQDANESIRLEPERSYGYLERGAVFDDAGMHDEALRDIAEALRLEPNSLVGRWRSAELLNRVGRHSEAVSEYRRYLSKAQRAPNGSNALAWILATSTDEKLLDGPEAVRHARNAAEQSGWKERHILDTLAAAHARSGDFASAVLWQKKALELCTEKRKAEVDGYVSRLEMYRRRQAYTELPEHQPELAWSLKRYETFKEVWSTVDRNYFDPAFGGVNWAAVREQYAMKLHTAEDNRALRQLLRQMLGELNRTHLGILPREASVFSTAEQGRRGEVGAVVSVVQGKVVVRVVRPLSSAAEGGLRPGDRVEALNGTALDAIETSMAQAGVSPSRIPMYVKDVVEGWFCGPVGTEIKLGVEGPDGGKREVMMKCSPATGEWSEPAGYCPAMPVEFELIQREAGIYYLRFNAFALPAMRRFRTSVRTLHAGDALILDLRNNRGGLGAMAAGICGLLTTREFSLGSMRLRTSKEALDVYPQRGAFSGPVAVLVDRASASTAEILAAGLRDAGRARLFGETTAGAALPSHFKSLPTNDILQYAVAEMTTPRGLVIEGHGIDPDEIVVMSQADCAQGRDPLLEAAVTWLKTQSRGGPLIGAVREAR